MFLMRKKAMMKKGQVCPLEENINRNNWTGNPSLWPCLPKKGHGEEFLGHRWVFGLWRALRLHIRCCRNRTE